jgi:Glycosyl transferase family 2
VTSSATAAGIRLLAVVVPVRDEAERLASCLAALDTAGRKVHRGRGPALPRPRIRTIVVLDACADHSAAIALARPGVELVPSSAGRVGAARATGVDHVLLTESLPFRQVWLATTDADSTVPADWLSHQLDAANGGAMVFRGLVEPDPRECGRSAYRAWSDSYLRVPGHPHVHGANLGIRADAYLACGGFDPFAAAGEDVALVRRARERALPVVASAGAVVRTSGRLVGRVTGPGYATYLADRAG